MINKSFMTSANYSNSDYIKDLVNYTIGDDSIEISVMPKNLSANQLKIPSSQVYRCIVLAMLALPIAFGVAAIVVYIKRKHL
jgi:hypothetical protein